jgi:hypothetical protein
MARSQFFAEQKLPIARVLKGDFYKAREKDSDGVAYTVKEGPNAGKPNPQFFYAVGIPKTKAHWGQEPWGLLIWNIGNACFPKIAESDTFSWKVTDGDSDKPNRKGNKPCENEGYPGHWVISFNSSLAPRLLNDKNEPLLAEGVVMPGDYVQIYMSCDGNSSTKNPGVYINAQYVRFVGHSAKGRIIQGRDPSSIDWGNDAAPSDLVHTPVAASASPAPAAPKAPASPPPPVPGAAASAPAPLALTPAPGFLAPPPPPAPPAAPVRKMTGAYTYEALKAANWSDEQMIAAGHMVGP